MQLEWTIGMLALLGRAAGLSHAGPSEVGDGARSTAWQRADCKYRVVIRVDAAGYARQDKPVELRR